MKVRAIGIALASLAGFASPACAAERVYVGLLQHNIRVIDAKNADKEDGPNLEAEVQFRSPALLGWAGAPRPYVMASANLSGATSFAAVGLSWEWAFAPGWALEPAFGYAIHDGEVKNPFPNGDPRATTFSDENLLLGSRDLFRSSLGLTRQFSPRWSGQVYYEHLSHGQIIGSGRNQGVDQAGVRIGWRPAR